MACEYFRIGIDYRESCVQPKVEFLPGAQSPVYLLREKLFFLYTNIINDTRQGFANFFARRKVMSFK